MIQLNFDERKLAVMVKQAVTEALAAMPDLPRGLTTDHKNLLCETGMFKKNIDRELKIKKSPEEGIAVVKSDIDVAEKAIKELDESQKQNQKSSCQWKKWVKNIIDKLSNIDKAIKLIASVTDYIVKLIDAYNK